MGSLRSNWSWLSFQPQHHFLLPVLRQRHHRRHLHRHHHRPNWARCRRHEDRSRGTREKWFVAPLRPDKHWWDWAVRGNSYWLPYHPRCNHRFHLQRYYSLHPRSGWWFLWVCLDSLDDRNSNWLLYLWLDGRANSWNAETDSHFASSYGLTARSNLIKETKEQQTQFIISMDIWQLQCSFGCKILLQVQSINIQ